MSSSLGLLLILISIFDICPVVAFLFVVRVAPFFLTWNLGVSGDGGGGGDLFNCCHATILGT